MSLSGALRYSFRTRAELALENLALRLQLANLRHTSGRPRIRMAGGVFWLVRPACDPAGRTCFSSSSQTLRSAGTGLGYACPEGGSPVRALRPQLISPLSPRRSSVRWPRPIHSGERPKSKGNCSNSASRSSEAYPATCRPSHASCHCRPGVSLSDNHLSDMPSIDLFTVPTATLLALHLVLVLSHNRWRVVC